MPSIETIMWGLSIAGFSSVGSYFLVKTLVQAGIEKAIEYNFNQKIESQKTSLKKSEIYFNMQLEALGKIRSIKRKVVPSPSYPEMDWDDACEVIADGFSGHEDALTDFLCRYEAVLPKEVGLQVQKAACLANEGRFQYSWNSQARDAEVTPEAIDTADKLCEALNNGIDSLQSHVDAQVSTK